MKASNLTAATAARIDRRGRGPSGHREGGSLGVTYDHSLTPALLLAALEDDGWRIKDLVSRGAWTECRTDSGATPLMCAAAKGAGDAIDALIEAGADVGASDAVGASALTLAAFHGRLATVTQLLDDPADPRAHPSEGAAPGPAGAVRRTAEALLVRPTHGGETPVMAAAKAGHARVVDELARRMKGDVASGATADGHTPLALACRHGHVDVVRVLLTVGGAGGCIDERSGRYGMTPLMHAACKGQTEVVAYLLTHAADVKPVDVTARDALGMTAALHAAAAGSVACWQALVNGGWPGEEPGARRERDNKGRNALMLAARFGSAEMVRYLLDTGDAGVMAAGEFDDQGESPLFAAIKGGHVAFEGAAELLHRAYPVHEEKLEMLEVKNQEGNTPLLWAAAHGREEAVKWLVGKGANMLAVDRKGRLPRQTADEHGHHKTSALLSELARNEWMRL